MARPTLQDQSLSRLDELVARHGAADGARLYVAELPDPEVRALAAPFVLVLARRVEANDLRRFDDG